MIIEIKSSKGRILYSQEQSEFFPDYCSVLKYALFNGVDLEGLYVKNENLDKIVFRNKKIRASFRNCSLVRAKFIDLEGDLGFYGCDLRWIKFRNSKLIGLYATDSDLSNSLFIETDCRNSSFMFNNMTYSEFDHSDLKKVGFNGTSLVNAKFIHSELESAGFVHIDREGEWMKDVRFEFCKLDECDFTWISSLKMIHLIECNIEKANTNGKSFTKIITEYCNVLYDINEDIVWMGAYIYFPDRIYFRGTLETLNYELENDFPNMGVNAPKDIFISHELEKICIYLAEWKKGAAKRH
jgi:uncharacterized protein YjbI with pentapeptide repeats